MLSQVAKSFGFRETAKKMIEQTDESLALKILLMLVGALFVAMTGIGGFTAAHLIGQADDLNTRITLVQTQIAASDVARQDIDLRLKRIEMLLDETREKLK